MEKILIEKDVEYSHDTLIMYYCGNLISSLPIHKELKDGEVVYKTDVDYEIVLRKVRKPRKRKNSKEDQYKKIQNEVIRNNLKTAEEE